MSDKRILILCKGYNAERYVEETITSVLGQTYANLVFIFKDNASTDNTYSIVKKYADIDPRVVLVHSDYNDINEPEKANFPDWKVLVNPSSDDYFTTIDADDYYEPNGLELLMEAAKKYDADLVLGGCIAFAEEDKNKKTPWGPQCTTFYADIREAGKDWISFYPSLRTTWGTLYRYDLWAQIQDMVMPYNVINGVDTLQNILALQVTRNLATVKDPVINYRYRNTSLYRKRTSPDRFRVYNIIRDESVKILNDWNCLDPERIWFVESCRESSMTDLVKAVAEGSDTNENKCELLYNIFSNVGFGEGLKAIGERGPFFLNSLKLLAGNELFIKECRYENYVLMMMYGAAYNNLALFIAGLFCRKNVNAFGASLLNELFKTKDVWIARIFPGVDWGYCFEKDKKSIVLLCNRDYFSLAKRIGGADVDELRHFVDEEWANTVVIIKQLKKDIANAMDSGADCEQLFEKARVLAPLEKEIVSNLMLYDIGKGNRERLIDVGLMVRSVFADDAVMLGMAGLAFEYLSLTEVAADCYDMAAQAEDDPLRRQELMNEVDRLKK